MRCALIVVALLCAAACLWMLFASRTNSPTYPIEGWRSEAQPPSELLDASPAPRVVADAVLHSESARPQVQAPRVFPAQRSPALLRGRVVDEFGQALADALVRLEPDHGAIHPWLSIGEDRKPVAPQRSGADGRFAFEALPAGPYLATASVADGRTGQQRVAALEAGGDEVLLRLSVDGSQNSLAVYVVDSAEQPVAQALVELHFANHDAASASETVTRSASSNAAGLAHFSAVPQVALRIDVRCADARVGMRALGVQQRRNERNELRIVVAARGAIAGRLEGADSAALAGSRVRAWFREHNGDIGLAFLSPVFEAPLSGEQFAFADLPAGDFELQLVSPAGWRLRAQPVPNFARSAMPVLAQVQAGETAVVVAQVEQGGAIEGRVYDPHGQAIENARVRAVLGWDDPNDSGSFAMSGAHVWRLDFADSLGKRQPATRFEAFSDAQGRYRLEGLAEGRYRLEVFCEAHAFEQRLGIELRGGETLRFEHELAPAGVLQGCALGTTYLGVMPAGSAKPCMLAILPGDGLFCFAGLASGDYDVGSFHSNSEQPLVALARVHIDAGRTTWIDLSSAGSVLLDGRLVDGDGEPVVGALELAGRRTRTAADGSFQLRLARPLAGQFGPATAEVEVDGLHFEIELPPEALGVMHWSGELRLGKESLELLLLDPDGRPAQGSLQVSGRPLKPSLLAVGADGRLRLEHLFPGELVLYARVKGAWTQAQALHLPHTGVLELSSLATAAIEVHVEHQDGRPAGHLRVIVCSWRGSGPPPADEAEFYADAHIRELHSDLAGNTRLDLPPGHVLVQAMGWYDAEPLAQTRVQTLRGQTSSVTLRFP